MNVQLDTATTPLITNNQKICHNSFKRGIVADFLYFYSGW